MSSTRADDKILGFEYQFYYFLLKVLKIDADETIGFEVKDDVHIENNKTLSLIQLKHTRQTNSDGEPINLTTSDIDLWKTFSNWVDVIQKEPNKKDFINSTNFVFITNKNESEKHIFFSSLSSLKDNDNFDEFKNKIIACKNELAVDNKNKTYIANLLSLADDLLEIFVLKIDFVFNLDKIVDAIKHNIQFGKNIKESRVGKVFHELTGLYKEQFFDVVKNKKNFELTQEKFYLETLAIFENARTERLPFNTNIEKKNNENILSNTFAKQLLDIGFDKNEVFEADYNKIFMETNLNIFLQNSVISENDKELLDSNTIENWKEEFKFKYLKNNNKTQDSAKELYLSVLKKDLDLAGQKIEWKLAIKGQFIRMSDIPKIGWKYNWEKEYANEV